MRITCLLICACFLIGCNLRPSVRGNEGSLQAKSESAEESIPSDQEVDFEGVSFHYDPLVFGDVTKQVVPEHKLEDPTDKPDYVEPKNVRFDFEFKRKDGGGSARLVIYTLEEFDDAYAIDPHMVKWVNDEIAGLRKVLRDPSFRIQGQIPRVEFADASDDFYVKVRQYDFQSGDGIIFVTHWNSEVSLISNRNLVYRFEGITADGKYFIVAETPVSVAFLPDTSPVDFEGYTARSVYFDQGSEAKLKSYRKSISTRLEKLNANDYSPSLEKFEEIISSLKIDSVKP